MLNARLSGDGSKVHCGMARCNGTLATVNTRDLRTFKAMNPAIVGLPDVLRTIFVADGFVPHQDGSWALGTHAGQRSERGLSPHDRREHVITQSLPHIVSGAATPVEHEQFAELLRERDSSLPTPRAIDKPTIIVCPNPKCRRPNLVDPDALHIQNAE